MRREAEAYQLKNILFLHGKKRTDRTVPILSEPIFQFDNDDQVSKIGNTVRECIEAFSEGHPHPSREEFKKVNDPLIKLAGEKTPKSFFSKVKWVGIVEKGGKISFAPTENHGWKEGFKNTEYSNIELDYASATNEDLGKALLKAFELSSFI
jgi:hypothetical protein